MRRSGEFIELDDDHQAHCDADLVVFILFRRRL